MNEKWRLLLWKYCSWRKGIGLGLLIGFVALFSVVNVMMGSSVGASQQEVLVQGEENKSVDGIRQEAERLFKEGLQLYQQKTEESLRKALQKWEEVLLLWRKLDDKEWEAVTLTGIGRVYSDLGEKQKALEFYKLSLPLWQQVRNKEGEATTLTGIGGVYSNLGEKEKALEFYNQSLPLSRQVGDKQGEATTLNNIGILYDDLGENQKALEFYNQSLDLWRQVEDKKGEASTLNNIGNVYNDLGEKQKALDLLNQSLALSRQAEHKEGEARTLNNIGSVYSDLGENQKALEFYKLSLTLSRQVGDKVGETATLNSIGKVYNDLGENQKALEFYNLSLAVSKQAEHKEGEARSLNNIGSVYSDLGEKQKALDLLNQSLALSRQVGDKVGEVATLNSIGKVYSDLEENQKALEFLNQSLALWRQVGNKKGEAATLNSIGKVYSELGENQKGLEFYNQSLSLSKQVGNKQGEARTLNNIGSVYSELGEKQKALEFYNQSLSLSKQVGNKQGEAQTLNNIGSVYSDLGEKQKALEFYNQSLSLSKQVGNKKGETATLNNIAAVYNDLGEKQKALSLFNQSLSLSKQVGNKKGEATTLNNIAAVYNDLGEKQKALEFYNQSLNLRREVGDKAGEATTLNNIGKVYSDLGEKQKALEFYNQSLNLRREVGDKGGEAVTLNNIGSVYSNLGENQKALDFYNQSLPLSRQVENKEREATTLHNIAALKLDNGQLNEALTDIKQATEIIEDLRTKVVTQELRTSFFAQWQAVYRTHIDILMALHKQNPNANHHITALEISERARSRSLIELLTEANADIRKDIDPKLLQQERQLIQQIGAKTQALQTSKLSDEEREKIKTEIITIQTQLQQVETEIKKISPRYADLKYPDPLTISQIQEVVDKDTLLLSYWLGEDRSYLWAVTPDSVTVHELPKGEDIATTVQEFRKFLEDLAEQNTGEVEIQAAKVSEMLLKPVADQLKNKRLAIVSDGIIQYIPFSVLPPPTTNPDLPYQPLIVNHEIVNLPSASTIYNQRKYPNKLAPKTIAVMADPVFSANDERVTNKNISQDDTTEQELKITVSLTRGTALDGQGWRRLPYTRQEAEQILALVPDNQKMQVYDFGVNLKNAQAPEISNYRIVHLATHGFFNDELPENSGIVLSLVNEQGKEVEGYLTTPNVFNLNLPAELIVLSACKTGLGKQVSGEGLVGLTRGLMYAGGERVMVSLWSVDDGGTSELMVKFYQKMWQENLSPAAALRAAQLEMWNEGEVAFLWAPFVLQGEWR